MLTADSPHRVSPVMGSVTCQGPLGLEGWSSADTVMRFGIFTFSRAPYAEIARHFRVAEELVGTRAPRSTTISWCPTMPTSSRGPARRAGARHPHIRLGTMVTAINFRHPTFLAARSSPSIRFPTVVSRWDLARAVLPTPTPRSATTSGHRGNAWNGSRSMPPSSTRSCAVSA